MCNKKPESSVSVTMQRSRDGIFGTRLGSISVDYREGHKYFGSLGGAKFIQRRLSGIKSPFGSSSRLPCLARLLLLQTMEGLLRCCPPYDSPGKSNYSPTKSHRPIALVNTMAELSYDDRITLIHSRPQPSPATNSHRQKTQKINDQLISTCFMSTIMNAYRSRRAVSVLVLYC